MGRTREQRQFVVLSTAFILTGAATVVLGPLLPELRERWQVGAAELAWLFTAQFASSALGSVLSTRRIKLSLLGGYSMIGLGLLLLANGGRPTALPALALMGFGLGCALPATNLIVAFGDPETRGASLAKLNLIWGVGATGFPLLLALLAHQMPLSRPTTALGALCLLALVPLRSVQIPAGAGEDSGGSPPETRETPQPTPLSVRGPLSLLPFAAIFFFYVGTETTFGGWLVSLVTEMQGEIQSETALLIGSLFWGALLIGRALASSWLLRTSEARVFASALGVAIIGTLLLIVAGRPATVALGACLGGLGLAPLYPLTVALMTRWSENIRVQNTGWVFAFAGLGGASVPWAAGQLTALYGSARIGFFAPAACLAAIVVLFRLVILQRSPT